MTNWQVYKRLLTYLHVLWIPFAISVAGNGIFALASMLMAAAMEPVVEAIQNPTQEYRLLVPLMIIGVFALRGLGSFLGTYYIAVVARNIVRNMRQQLFERMILLPCRFFDDNSPGHLVSRITYNVEQVTGAATNALTIIIREGLTVIFLLSYMFYMNWKLTLIFLSVGPLIGLVVGFVSKRLRDISRRIQGSMGDITHVASEAISGYRVVRIFGGEAYENNRFEKVNEFNIAQSMKLALTQALSTPVVQLLISFSIAILVWLALAPEVLGNMTIAEFIAYITAATTIAKPIRQLTDVNSIVQRGLAGAQDVFAHMDQQPEVDTGQFDVDRVRGDLELRNVNFRYAPDQDDVLHSISLVIPAGKTVALVGRSGSGKSTLSSLIPRFYDTSAGEILLDGRLLNDYKLVALRRQISLVTQQVTLFNDTIANNIAYGRRDQYSDDDIICAAEAAHAMEFISQLPDGLETLVGDNGLRLSGGQRQRLAIARAILKDSPLLILDEATSALDTQSERHIQDALEAVMKGRTTIVIAHRLSTIENADMIVVLEKGVIVETGSHPELLARDGQYAALHQMQFREG
jgi:ATP-binding cassette, subfamily B, bacterial MsbA